MRYLPVGDCKRVGSGGAAENDCGLNAVGCHRDSTSGTAVDIAVAAVAAVVVGAVVAVADAAVAGIEETW